jgi:hypothetical protein
LDIVLDLSAAMRLEAIPNQDDRSLNLAQELFQEAHDHDAGDVAFASYLEEQPHRSESWAQTKCRDDRHFSQSSGAMNQERGFAQRRPGAADMGRHHEPRFIEKYEMGPKSFRFFLSRSSSP